MCDNVYYNDFRYLIFFDDGYAQYSRSDDIHKVLDQSRLIKGFFFNEYFLKNAQQNKESNLIKSISNLYSRYECLGWHSSGFSGIHQRLSQTIPRGIHLVWTHTNRTFCNSLIKLVTIIIYWWKSKPLENIECKQ